MATCVQGIESYSTNNKYRHYRSSITAFTPVQRMSFDGVKIISMSSNHFGNFSILTMKELIKGQIVLSLNSYD